MKKTLLLLMVFATTYVMPVTAQASEEFDTEVTAAQFEELLPNVADTATKYATSVVNIRKEPNVDSEILGTSMVNTSFEVVLNIGGWSMITTEDGYAYMKSDWFVDEPVDVLSYTEEDLYILAHVLAGEAQSYSDDEQRYVGSVVLNRVRHPEFPDTIKDVVFQKGQYASTWDGNYYRDPTERNWVNARYLLENGSILPDDVIWQSGGKQGKGVYLKTDVHYYCY